MTRLLKKVVGHLPAQLVSLVFGLWAILQAMPGVHPKHSETE